MSGTKSSANSVQNTPLLKLNPTVTVQENFKYVTLRRIRY